jgi:hypothetical protein
MKKRTACFGWTKRLQWRVKHARDLMALALKVRDATVSKRLRDTAAAAMGKIEADHIARVKQLRVVA